MDIVATITEALEEVSLPSLRFAYVFGSAARGQLRSDSDLDLAVDVGRPLTLEERGQLADLVEATTHRQADIADLQTAGLVLQMEVLRDGVVVAERDSDALAEFQMYTPSRYEDFRLDRREIDRALLARFAK